MKLDDGRFDGLLAAEPSCLRLASDAGLHAAHSNLTVPTALWQKLRPTAAMSVNGKHEDVTRDDFVAEAHRWGSPGLGPNDSSTT